MKGTRRGREFRTPLGPKSEIILTFNKINKLLTTKRSLL
jgi:hypothetical protein